MSDWGPLILTKMTVMTVVNIKFSVLSLSFVIRRKVGGERVLFTSRVCSPV